MKRVSKIALLSALSIFSFGYVNETESAVVVWGADSIKGGIDNLIETVVDVVVSEKDDTLIDPSILEGRKSSSDGAGFIVHEDGFIATNWHVIEGADKIRVVLSNGSEYSAKIVGKDERSDIALLKIDAPMKLRAVKFANSDEVKIGAPVIAIGNPLGFGKTVTSGIISFKGRNLSHQIAELGSGGDLVSYLQTDASVNYGNSGGPLFSFDGEVIGMVTVFVSDGMHSVGINFAIPSNLLQRVLEQLKSYGKLQRSWLGIAIVPIKPEVLAAFGLENRSGCNITYVAPNSPAAAAGIKVGDILLSIDNENITDTTTMEYMLNNLQIGSIIPVQVLRKGIEIKFNLTVGAKNDDDALGLSEEVNARKEIPSERIDAVGMSVTDLNSDLRQYFGIPSKIRGVLISNYDNFMGELSVGCVITEINQIHISSVAEFKTELNKLKSKNNNHYAALYIFDPQRKPNSLYYTAVKVNWANSVGLHQFKVNSKENSSDSKKISSVSNVQIPPIPLPQSKKIEAEKIMPIEKNRSIFEKAVHSIMNFIFPS